MNDPIAAEYLPIDSLFPWAGNPRKNAHVVDRAAKSIDRFGFGAPIVARRANREIIAGHTRWAAAKQLGLDRVPVRLMDLDEDEAHALALVDNKLGEMAEWDIEKLGELGHLDLGELGWSMEEVEALAGDPGGDDGPPEPDESQPAESRLGEIYALGPHRLMCGSALSPDHRAALLVGETPGVVILDPPYEMDDAQWTPLIADPCIVFGQARHLRCIPMEIWRFERVIDKVTAHRSATVQIGHRHAFVAQCGTDRRLPRVPDTFPSIVAHPDRPEHPHEKPVDLLVEHLTHWTPEWRIVVDWFAGSGSAMIAAHRMHRAARMMELDPHRCDTIRERWRRLVEAA